MITDLALAREMVARVPKWFHAFELLPGLVTPGRQVTRPREHLNHLGIDEDLRDARALEIGTWDGPVAFELERRGAKVIALDIQDSSPTSNGQIDQSHRGTSTTTEAASSRRIEYL